ncbi:RNA polymerase sigma factor [Oceaniferula spumae]|uniref:RNA polymerase sigma factor n=1 Tax=Oceaniferula spumae TaxID=2979115 RepID=UPI003F4E46BD
MNSATASISKLSQGASRDADGRRKPSAAEGYEWGTWLAENGSRLLLFARQQTRSTEDAQDVLQDALVKLARKIDEGVFDGGQEAWKPYLYTTIRRLSIDLGRKNDRRSKREEKSEADRRGETGGMSDPWFEGGAANDETRNLLEEGLKKLPTKFSEVIIMKIWGENTFAEIGEILGVSLNTVASRYRYGLERLRKGLEGARHNEDI